MLTRTLNLNPNHGAQQHESFFTKYITYQWCSVREFLLYQIMPEARQLRQLQGRKHELTLQLYSLQARQQRAQDVERDST